MLWHEQHLHSLVKSSHSEHQLLIKLRSFLSLLNSPFMATKKTPKTLSASASDTKGLRSDLYILKMKHAMRELKETHKIKKARQALARHLTKLHNA